jgi:hypothetical protein
MGHSRCKWLAHIVVLAYLSACGGGSGDSGDSLTVSGRFTYDLVPTRTFPTVALDYNNTRQSPIRGATVELLSSNDTVLSTTVTDTSGGYSFTLPQDQAVRLRLRAELLKTTGASRYDVRVVDNSNGKALYTLAETSSSSMSSKPVRNLNAASGWDGRSYAGLRASAPFAIMDSVYKSMTRIMAIDDGVVFSPLLLNWSVNNIPVSGDRASGAIGTSSYVNGNIYILGAADSDTDEFDDHVIIHEWGHYLEDTLSRSDSIGGPHGAGDRLDMRVAFGEGFGNALSAIITDDPQYVDTFGANQANGFIINVDENNVTNPGWYSEASVQSILYDLYDGNNDGNDIVSLGLARLYHTFINEQRTTAAFTSIFSFITALKADNGSQSASIDQLVNGQSINSTSIDSFGTRETNDAGLSDHVLPVYTTLTVDGGPVNVCTITAFNRQDYYNTLSNQRFLSFSIPSQGSYTITVVKASAAFGATDPDFTVLRNGMLKSVGQTETVDRESVASTLDTGTHVMAVTDFTIRGRGARGTACFNVSVTTN